MHGYESVAVYRSRRLAVQLHHLLVQLIRFQQTNPYPNHQIIHTTRRTGLATSNAIIVSTTAQQNTKTI